jgi:hypothetical protein
MTETNCLWCGKPSMTAWCTNRCEEKYRQKEKDKQEADNGRD